MGLDRNKIQDCVRKLREIKGEELTMNKTITAIIIAFCIALAGETVFLFSQLNKQNTLTQDLFEAQVESEQLSTEIDTISLEKDSLLKEKEDNSTQLATLSVQVETLTAENKALKTDINTKKGQISELQAKQRSMEQKFMCDKTIGSINFSDNKSVNDALVKYVNQTKGISEPISAHYWKIIWTGEKYSTHTIEVHSEKDRTNYIWTFTAYFRGEAYGEHENGVFYNDEQCWIYLDK